MARTTVDIDDSVLRAVKRMARRSGKSLGQTISELLATVVGKAPAPARHLDWRSAEMRALVDLEDKDAVQRALEAE